MNKTGQFVIVRPVWCVILADRVNMQDALSDYITQFVQRLDPLIPASTEDVETQSVWFICRGTVVCTPLYG